MGMGNIATSGMRASMTNMEVISNNIANAPTYGFKSSFTNFADIFPSTGSSVQAGLGVKVTGITQNFSPGGPTPTGGKADLAITNDSFFIMKDVSNNQTTYSRYGRFKFEEGYFTIGGSRLQGFSAVNNEIPAGSNVQDLYIDPSPFPPLATTTVTQDSLNLDSASTIPTVTPFDPNNRNSYTTTNNANVYDSLGAVHNLSLYYIKTAANQWTVNAYVDNAAAGVGSLTFTSLGELSAATGLNALSFSPTTGATSPQNFSVDMVGTTQYGKPFGTKPFLTNGYPSGEFAGYTIDKNGYVNVNYTNSQTTLAGQIALAKFQSPEGLQNIGDMTWMSTTESGGALVSQANSQSALQQGALEMSNVDLATEMVNLITAQSIFQANAQVEQTYNQVIQTVTQL